MSSLTDRYVHAVTSQLPEAQRADIAEELRGTIEDTVAASPEGMDPAEAERQALLELGHPIALADNYRGEGRSLIGPRLYPAWLRTLKALLMWVPALVGVIMLIVGVIDQDPPLEVLGSVVSGIFYAAIMVAFWVTLGFAIAERTGGEAEVLEVFGGPDDWDPAGLPEPQRRQVSWGDGILSVVVNAFLLTILLLPGRLGGDLEGFAWGQIFTDTAYSLRWVLAVGMAVSLLASVFVLARGRWTWPTALANAAGTVLFVGPLVWLAARDDLYAWHTLPTAWLNDSDGTFQVNEQSTLAVTIVVLVAIALWETWDTFYKASRAH